MPGKLIGDYIGAVPYPGDGAVMGKSSCGRYAVSAFFLSSRLPADRRLGLHAFADGVGVMRSGAIQAPDYTAVRSQGTQTIICNGGHMDILCRYLWEGKTAAQALGSCSYDRSSPEHTPAFCAIMRHEMGDIANIRMAMLRKSPDSLACRRDFYRYTVIRPGEGWLLYDFEADGKSFKGEPRRVRIGDSPEAVADELWQSLDPETRTAVFVRFQSLRSGSWKDKIINLE